MPTKMFKILALPLCILCFTSTPLFAQAPNIQMHVQQIAKGWTTDAKKALPDLLIDYPNDPAVMFLHASLVEDTKRAMPLLERIVTVFPKSEWADDALVRIIMYQCVNKEVEKARKSFSELREVYPQSDLLPVTYDVLRMSVGAPPPTAQVESAKKTSTASVAAPSATVATTTTTQPPTTAVKVYSLQTRSTFDKKEAASVVELFKKKRMRVTTNEMKVKGKTQYEVLVGEYPNEVEAAKDLDVVRKVCKCKPTVVAR
ncbi:MAG: hypothetical protein HQ472_11135 [Ignavibacteria bacterium]|nr:hypothetical protein [Ignavibacteria bacterium]